MIKIIFESGGIETCDNVHSIYVDEEDKDKVIIVKKEDTDD